VLIRDKCPKLREDIFAVKRKLIAHYDLAGIKLVLPLLPEKEPKVCHRGRCLTPLSVCLHTYPEFPLF